MTVGGAVRKRCLSRHLQASISVLLPSYGLRCCHVHLSSCGPCDVCSNRNRTLDTTFWHSTGVGCGYEQRICESSLLCIQTLSLHKIRTPFLSQYRRACRGLAALWVCAWNTTLRRVLWTDRRPRLFPGLPPRSWRISATHNLFPSQILGQNLRVVCESPWAAHTAIVAQHFRYPGSTL